MVQSSKFNSKKIIPNKKETHQRHFIMSCNTSLLVVLWSCGLVDFLFRVKCVAEVSDYIFNVFNTNSKADQTVGDACAFACFLAEF